MTTNTINADSQRDDVYIPGRYLLRRKIRNLLILAVLLVTFTEVMGVPYFRVSYTYRQAGRNKTMLSGCYYSITGRRIVTGDRCPLILLIPLDQSLFKYAADLLTDSPPLR